MPTPNPVTDRAAYIDKQVDGVVKAPPAPVQPAPSAAKTHPAANKAYDDMVSRIYGTQK